MFQVLFLRVILAVLLPIFFIATTGCAKDERRTESNVPQLGETAPSDTLNLSTVESTTTIRGALSYRERMALPPDALAVVEVRAGSIEGRVVGDSHIDLEGKQVPVPFEVSALLSPGKTYVARGAVFAGGLPAWVSDAVAIDPAQGATIDLGTMLMTRPAPGAYKSTLPCGDESVVVGFSKTAMLLTVGGETFEMKPVSAASGAKYEAVGDPTTTFWNKGDRTTITVKGRTLPECGHGNPAPAREDPSAAGASTAPGKELEGAEWVVQDIAGKKPIANSQVTLNFSGGTVAGKASCNSYTAQFTVARQVVTVSQPTSTMMMCEKLMDQEKSFLDILQKTKRYEITPDGALVLHTEDGRTLIARR
jgi:heat shock protein HslJ/uncharacterized lipoprotein YbaY